jgi:hypothetical protein
VAEGRVVRRVMPLDEVGWCHHCGTLQLFRDAPWLPVPFVFGDREPVPCCVECREAEPWELGVFAMPITLAECAEARHVTWGPPECESCDVQAA